VLMEKLFPRQATVTMAEGFVGAMATACRSIQFPLSSPGLA
jgi:hypothetical protein